MDSIDYVGRGDPRVKAEYTREHCRRLRAWFDRRGRFVHPGTPPLSRERLWNCMSLLAHGGRREVELARRIIVGTPVDANPFEAIAAVELLLRFPRLLGDRCAAHLARITREHLLNLFEIRFGSADTHNFTCMGTWFLLAASRILDGYEWKHPLGSIPEVYTRRRIFEIGLNALYSLAYQSEHAPVFHEWNSPTYSPISLHSLAKIVELLDHPQARQVALGIEIELWREILSFYHPTLGLSCGPWSRAYRCDVLGQISQMRILLAYVGVSGDRSVAGLFDESQKDIVFHHDGDIPFCWSGPAWQMAGRYHLPADALAELRRRRFPHRFEAPIQWGPFGHVEPRTGKYFPVQGTAVPGGQGAIVQTQHRNWALGHRSLTVLGHSFPINLHYALVPTVRTMRDARSVTAAVVFRSAPQEWVPDQQGRPMEAGNFNNEGRVEVTEAGKALVFRARQLPGLSATPSSELSLNTFVSLHFVPAAEASLNGEVYREQPIVAQGRKGVCRVADAGFVYEIVYEFPRPVEMRLYRWANFLRFTGFWFEGQPRVFSTAGLERLTARGSFRVIRHGDGCRECA